MVLTQDTFDDGLEKNAFTLLEFVKVAGRKVSWLGQLRDGKLLSGTGFGRVHCESEAALCEELLTNETAAEKDQRDVMLYARDAMTAHLLPRTVADTAEAVAEWARAEMARIAEGSAAEAREANQDEKEEFDWKALKDPSTVALDDASFASHIAGENETLVDFYATWCHHCQALAPVWADAASSAPDVRFAKVNVDKADAVSSRYGVEGLPTIVKVRGDRYVEFSGERTKEAILAFARTRHAADDSLWRKAGEPRPPASEEEQKSEVADAHSLVLTDSSFETLLAGKTAVVEFYAPWCGHCQSLQPVWAEAAAGGSPIVFGKVNVDQNELMSSRFSVEGLPTILKIRGDRFVEFHGDRSKDAILAFARSAHPDDDAQWRNAGKTKQHEPSSTEVPDPHSLVLTDKDFHAQLAGKTAVIDFYAPWCGHCQSLAPIWAAAAAEGSPVVFAKVNVDENDATASQFNVEGLPTICKVRGNRFIEFKGDRSKSAILEFARKEHNENDPEWQTVGEVKAPEPSLADASDIHSVVLTDKTFADHLAGKTAIVEYYAPWCSHCQSFAPIWAAAAADGAPLVFAKVNVDENDEVSALYDVQGLPTIQKVRGKRFIKYQGARTKEAILDFARTEHADNDPAWRDTVVLEPLSTPDPATLQPKDSAVSKDVVALDVTSFDAALAADASAVWMVEFYTPWCGHCKKLAPKWDEASKLATSPSLRFAKVDVDASRPLGERFKVASYPTILKIRGGLSEVYEGEREAASIVEWALEPLNGPPQPAEIPISAAVFDESYTATEQTWLLVFTASWCSHCRQFKPVFRDLLTKLSPNVRAHYVDADKSPDLVEAFSVTELPTILLVRDGAVTKYGGQREVAPLLAFVAGNTDAVHKVQSNVPALSKWSAPPGVEHHLTDLAVKNALKTGKHLLVLLGGRRDKRSEEMRRNYLPKLALVPDGNQLRVAVVESVLTPMTAAVLNPNGQPMPFVVYVENNQRFWGLPFETYAADELLGMVLEHDLPEKEAIKLGFSERSPSSAPAEEAVEEEDEFGERKGAAESPLPGLEKHEENVKSQMERKKKQEFDDTQSDAVVFSEPHLKQLLEGRGPHHRHRWAILFYDSRDPEWERIWRNIWRETNRQLKGTARGGLVSWRDEGDLPDKLGVTRGFQAGVFEGGSFYLAPEIEGDGPLVVEQLVRFAKGGYLAVTPQTGVPGTGHAVQTLTDSDFVARTSGTEPWLISFGKPGCALCSRVENLVERVAHAVPGLHVAQVNTATARGVSKLERIDYHPTLKVRAAGRSFVYTGENEYEELIAFVKQGWKERELKARPQPISKHLNPQKPEEPEEDPEAIVKLGASPTQRLYDLLAAIQRNGIALALLVANVVAVSVALSLWSRPGRRSKGSHKGAKVQTQKLQKQKIN